MASDLTITGTMTANVAPSGPSAAAYIGSPKTYASSSTLTIEYEEDQRGSMTLVSGDGAQSISFGAMTTVKALYIGADKQITVAVDGNSYTIGDGSGGTDDGGFLLLTGCDVSTLTVTAALAVSTTVAYLVFGE